MMMVRPPNISWGSSIHRDDAKDRLSSLNLQPLCAIDIDKTNWGTSPSAIVVTGILVWSSRIAQEDQLVTT